MRKQRECGPCLKEFDDVEVLDFGDGRTDSRQHAPDDCKGRDSACEAKGDAVQEPGLWRPHLR